MPPGLLISIAAYCSQPRGFIWSCATRPHGLQIGCYVGFRSVDKKQRSRGILDKGRYHTFCREQCHFAWGMESEEISACFSGLNVKELLLTGESIVRGGDSEMKPGEDIH